MDSRSQLSWLTRFQVRLGKFTANPPEMHFSGGGVAQNRPQAGIYRQREIVPESGKRIESQEKPYVVSSVCLKQADRVCFGD